MIFEAFWDEARFAAETAMLREHVDNVADGTILIGADLDNPAPAVKRLVEIRRRGELAALYPVMGEPVEMLARPVFAEIAKIGEPERANAALHQLAARTLEINQRSIDSYNALRPEHVRGIYAALRAADLVAFPNYEQQRRWEKLIGRRLFRTILVGPRSEPAWPEAQRGSTIVVYAPERTRAELAFFDVAFARRSGPWHVVCREQPDESVLDGAALVATEDWHRPLTAHALAARGFRVVAPASCGATERGWAVAYDPLNVKSFYRAIDTAFTLGPPQVVQVYSTPDDLRGALESLRPTRVDGPVVSVIMRTHDRRPLLERAIESIATQVYRDVELVLVNDSGPDVADLVAAYENRLPIKYERFDRNIGEVPALNRAISLATGTYVMYLDDDDIIYPDHLSRLVDALENTGALVAYANSLAEYADQDGEGLHPYEYVVFRDWDFEREKLFQDNIATMHSFCHRRELLDRFGTFDELLKGLYDWEMWIRWSRTMDFVHVDWPTCEYSWRFDVRGSHVSARKPREFADAQLRIVQEKYPEEFNARPAIRDFFVKGAANRRAGAEILEREPWRAKELYAPPMPDP